MEKSRCLHGDTKKGFFTGWHVGGFSVGLVLFAIKMNTIMDKPQSILSVCVFSVSSAVGW